MSEEMLEREIEPEETETTETETAETEAAEEKEGIYRRRRFLRSKFCCDLCAVHDLPALLCGREFDESDA